MTNNPNRFLFNAHNRRGLGHLMRGLNIAREIRKSSPSADIQFYTRSESAVELCGREFNYIIEQDLEHHQCWPELVAAFQPNVIIYDTVLPKDTCISVLSDTKTVYIMRKCKPDRQQEIFNHPFTAQVDLIIIPHEDTEFGYALPHDLSGKSHFVGPIVRHAEAKAQQSLREKYGIGADDFLITSTVGGGGFEDKAQAFFSTVFRVHHKVYHCVPNLKHLLIKGPNFTGHLPDIDGLQIIESEKEMVNLLAISNLVIAEGGYNTVNEIRFAKTPAIFIPSDRNYDDQFERALELENKGMAFVFSQQNADGIAQLIIDARTDQTILAAVLENYKTDIVKTGNIDAAKLLIELANQ